MKEDCTLGLINKEKLDQMTKLMCERNTENHLLRKDVNDLQSDNKVLKNDIAHIKGDVSEIKQMILNDQVDRNKKREQVETNKKDIERHEKHNGAILLIIIGAFLKEMFFK